MKNKTASMTGLVDEFYIGQKVIMIYPQVLARIGIVVGINKVEGKVYVSWDGYVRQHDPDEIQQASFTKFFSQDGGTKLSSIENNEFKKLALAIQGWRVAGSNRDELKDWMNDFSVNPDFYPFVLNAYKKLATVTKADDQSNILTNENSNSIQNDRIPYVGECVVLLNKGGEKPGLVGVVLDVLDESSLVIKTQSSWSSIPQSGKHVITHYKNVVPIISHSSKLLENK